jgi:small subunit ribosomal protein S16
MLTIRLLRIGKKNQPSFKIVVVDKRKSSKAGSFVEVLGFKNRLTKKVGIKKDRVEYWMKVGAQPSVTVRNLLIENKIIEGKKTAVNKKSKKDKGTAPAAAAAPGAPVAAPAVPAEAPKQEEKPAGEIKPAA